MKRENTRIRHINQLRTRGMRPREAASEGALLRLLPIMMTMLVATLGLLPAAMSHDIGSDSQRPFAMNLPSLTAPSKDLTQQGMIVGTFQYMAPEVLRGQEAVARSDLCSLGCVLYEMVTGRRAFTGKSQLSGLTGILEKDPEPMLSMFLRLDMPTVREVLSR